MILATLAVICRFLSRRVKGASIGADDWMIVVGLIFTYATFADSVVRKRSTILMPRAHYVTPLMIDIIRGTSRGRKALRAGSGRESFSTMEGLFHNHARNCHSVRYTKSLSVTDNIRHYHGLRIGYNDNQIVNPLILSPAIRHSSIQTRNCRCWSCRSTLVVGCNLGSSSSMSTDSGHLG